MANNELAIRFTEGKYATKAEVARELRMSMIDTIWSNILNYRSTFNSYLSIKSIEKNQLIICSCPSINALINSTDMKLIRVMKEYSHLNVNNGDLKRFEDECLVKNLLLLAKKHELDVTENYVKSLIHGDIKEPASSMRVLVRYLDALKFIKRSHVNPINVDFLAELYGRLLGTDELTSFYRSTEDTNRENRVLIDRVYTSAPSTLIENMMESLFVFVANSPLSSACKASIAYYYINYIRPFTDYSDEIALLIAKAILAHFDLGEAAVLLPLESLLCENLEEIARLFVEVQKTSDTTYFIYFALKQMDKKCDELLDLNARIKADILKADFYREDKEKKPEASQFSYVIEQPSLFDTSAQQPAPEPIREEPRPVVREPEPQPQPQPQPQPEPVRVEPEQPKVEPVREEPKQEPVQETIAVSYIPPALDEKQALRLEQHLLELDPSLRKHEAHFYARHCTLGKSYTIAQYKRMIGCVYETARTAMDHLVELGYYRKDSSNKKFIYTPIPRK